MAPPPESSPPPDSSPPSSSNSTSSSPPPPSSTPPDSSPPSSSNSTSSSPPPPNSPPPPPPNLSPPLAPPPKSSPLPSPPPKSSPTPPSPSPKPSPPPSPPPQSPPPSQPPQSPPPSPPPQSPPPSPQNSPPPETSPPSPPSPSPPSSSPLPPSSIPPTSSPPPSTSSNTPPSSSPSDTSQSPNSPLPPNPSSLTPPALEALSPPPPRSRSSTPSKSLPSDASHSKGSNDSDVPSSTNHSNFSLPIIAGITAGVVVLLLLMIGAACLFCTKKKKKKKPHNSIHYYVETGSTAPKASRWQNGHQGIAHGGMLPPPPGAIRPGPAASSQPITSDSSSYSGQHETPFAPPLPPSLALGFSKSTFSYEELEAATNGFSQANLLGQGGFGYVHKAVFPNGMEAAVKQLRNESGQGERESSKQRLILSVGFTIDILCPLLDIALQGLIGCSSMNMFQTRPLRTTSMDLPPLDWSARIRIALGSAKGLAYLHEDCHPRIIHRDIKASNILLDYKFEAMVADFGLAKLSQDTNTHVSTRIMGTFGYLAPEYAASGKLTDKSDVFSYGVMLLELITGRRPVDPSQMEDSLADWARPLLAEALAEGNYDEIIDPRLEKNFDPIEMARMVSCAAASVRHSAKRRPRMSQIVRALEGDASLDDLNDGMKTGQSAMFSSSSEYDSDVIQL